MLAFICYTKDSPIMSGVKTIKHRTELIMENTRIDKAHEALDFIIESNGGLTELQIEALRELIDGGFLEADNGILILHN